MVTKPQEGRNAIGLNEEFKRNEEGKRSFYVSNAKYFPSMNSFYQTIRDFIFMYPKNDQLSDFSQTHKLFMNKNKFFNFS